MLSIFWASSSARMPSSIDTLGVEFVITAVTNESSSFRNGSRLKRSVAPQYFHDDTEYLLFFYVGWH